MDRELPQVVEATEGVVPALNTDPTEGELLGTAGFPYTKALLDAVAPTQDKPPHQALLDMLVDITMNAEALSSAAAKQGLSVAFVAKACEVSQDFAVALRAAQSTRINNLEEEAYRRAVHGDEETSYDREGNVSKVRTVYSDTLMKTLLEAELPEKYSKRIINDHTGKVDIDVHDARAKLMRSMSGAITTTALPPVTTDAETQDVE